MEAESQRGSIRKVDSSRSVDWIKDAWTLFKRAPGVWIGITVIWGLISLIADFVPLGDLASDLVLPVIVGGLMMACRRLDQGGAISLDAMLEGFRPPVVSKLILLGVLALAVGAVTDGMVDGSLGINSSDLLSRGSGSFGTDLPSVGLGSLLGALIAVLLLLLLSTALWFAPALVVCRQMEPLDAIMASFRGCLKNIWPLTVYSLLALLMLMAGSLPALLGLLVVLPVLLISIYCSYKDIYG